MDGLFTFLLLVLLFVMVIVLIRRFSGSSGDSGSSSASSASNPDQLVEDIKSMQTSRIVDQVSILEELGTTSSGYRQYCELVGTSQADSGVTAPYSQRKVAFYDVRCYRIERVGGRDVETLVAHERSIEPFYFTDGSCDTKMYVDLDSFENNVILVNSCNHIEGPNSDFSKAFAKQASASKSGTAYAMVGGLREAASGLLSTLGTRLGRTLSPRPRHALAFAGIGGVSIDPGSFGGVGDVAKGWNLAAGYPGGRSGGRSAGRPAGGRPGGSAQHRGGGGPAYTPRGSTSTHRGSMGGAMPPGLGDFLGGTDGMPFGGFGFGGINLGGSVGRSSVSDGADMLIGMGLGALLGSLSSTGGSNQQAAPQDTFRGYRIVEDVVPLASPIYCIGEIYRNGQEYYMGKSVSSTYTTSFFATKPEAEVISHLKSQ